MAVLLLAAHTLASGAHAPGAGTVHYDLRAALDPASGGVSVEASITLGPGVAREFDLAAPLAIEPDARPGVQRLPGTHHGAVRYRVTGAGDTLTIRYAGDLADAINGAGITLSHVDAWYPRFPGALLSFRLAVSLPQGWRSVSAGARAAGAGEVWVEEAPQESIHLVAARFAVSAQATPQGQAEVYLRRADPALAARYLDATRRYLGLYAELLGPYPYTKFALVENAAQTGYGMASFTLLGSRVIRLPFIVETSYPHEIVHSWLGNGVYVDPARGNWSEGFTAYLADHLSAERKGRGASYRRASLQRYASYVASERDFPLTAFRSRHDRASQAVGYGKAMMLAHMVRRDLGDEAFRAALRAFTARWMHRRASFDDLGAAFEAASGRSFDGRFDQWVERAGAPRLALAMRLEGQGSEDALAVVTISQVQDEAPYLLDVPLTLVRRDGAVDYERVVLEGREVEARYRASDLARVAVDADFDLFRRLDAAELPPSIGELLGRGGFTAIVPGDASPALASAYGALARGLGAVAVVADDAFAADAATPRLVLGWENRLLAADDPDGGDRAALAGSGVEVGARSARLGAAMAERADGACAVVAYRRADGRGAGGTAPGLWIGCDDPAAVGRLARKLPHYNRYGFLIFDGPGAVNRARDELPVRASPLAVEVPGGAPAPLPPPRVDRPLG